LAKISFPTAEFSCWQRISSPTAQVWAVGEATVYVFVASSLIYGYGVF
jgi:hypothetical protein